MVFHSNQVATHNCSAQRKSSSPLRQGAIMTGEEDGKRKKDGEGKGMRWRRVDVGGVGGERVRE